MRVVVPTLVVAAVSSGLAVVINLATEWKTNPWAWVGVVVLTLAAAGVSLWSSRSQGADAPGGGTHVERSVIGDVSGGTVVTGDGNQVQR
ncbi:hypothetical protein J7S33_17560 [Saccharothrix algeriensis]|uniref:Uncharacterized protein n=1 Tax=Saccharothrix algeriensis TaxID=173560 RepID=A0A8T8HRU0_9PSEU|nr:hypothetical protein J7S33_17560 [Saccharothrix algeriensis]